jgi:hypothetical protein
MYAEIYTYTHPIQADTEEVSYRLCLVYKS